MQLKNLTEKYTNLEAWMHDSLVGRRALNLHAYVLKQSALDNVLAEPIERSLLDVGCGGGQSAIRLKTLYPHLQISGIDLSEPQVARARQRAKNKELDLHFEIADAQDLPFPDSSFDMVYSFGSAKHWPDPLKGLGECWRVLKPGGELLITDATSDVALQQVENFYRVAGFPKLFRAPIIWLLLKFMFLPARPIKIYRQFAARLKMPEDTVSQLKDYPAFLFRTQKPAAGS